MAQPFGGVTYDFSESDQTMEEIFGDQDLAPTEVFKVLWAHVKENNLRVPKS